jgi:4-hydroxy-3-methylbut-2-enyl diphosphate reductase
MRVVLAESYGMCFGVRDAVALALEYPDPARLVILGQLVHNPEVTARLSERGIRSCDGPDEARGSGAVMISAHGASDGLRERLRSAGLRVVDATCPLVRHAHRALARLVEEGCFPVVVGRHGHVEVRGLVEDHAEHLVVETVQEAVPLPGRTRIGVVAQTTQPLEHVLDVVDALRAANPQAEVRFRDTVCQPTKSRRLAARRLASAVPVVVVVGGRNSNNTRELARTCRAEGAAVYEIESAAELRAEWFAGCDVVGLTAGTSTPEDVVDAVRSALEAMPCRHLAA